MKHIIPASLFIFNFFTPGQSQVKSNKDLNRALVTSYMKSNDSRINPDFSCSLFLDNKAQDYGYLCMIQNEIEFKGKWERKGDKILIYDSSTGKTIELNIKSKTRKEMKLIGIIDGYNYEFILIKNYFKRRGYSNPKIVLY